MLRASSGKHARLVGVCAAGGDSVPGNPRDPGICFFWLDLYPPIDVSTSPNFRPFAVNSVQIAHRVSQNSSDTLVGGPERKPYGFFFCKLETV